MRMIKALLVLAGVFCLLVYPGTSKADTFPITFLFTSDHLTGGYGSTGPFGTVTINEISGGFEVTVSLNDGSKFINTGAGAGLNFGFGATFIGTGPSSAITITGNTAASDSGTHSLTASYAPNGTTPFHMDGGGDFFYGITYTGQKTGGGSAIEGPIVFDVTGSSVTLAWLTAANADNQIFVADVISGVSGLTGIIDVSKEGVPVPEPGILILLGIAMTAVGVGTRFVRKI
jgi:hypothetical protein